MTIERDDPRLTAYVLGELDEAERQQVEQELERRPELRAEVESLRHVTQALSAQFESEEQPQLSPAQRERIASGVAGLGWRSHKVRRTLVALIAVAALVLVAIGIWPQFNERAVQLTRRDGVPQTTSELSDSERARPARAQEYAKEFAGSQGSSGRLPTSPLPDLPTPAFEQSFSADPGADAAAADDSDSFGYGVSPRRVSETNGAFGGPDAQLRDGGSGSDGNRPDGRAPYDSRGDGVAPGNPYGSSEPASTGQGPGVPEGRPYGGAGAAPYETARPERMLGEGSTVSRHGTVASPVELGAEGRTASPERRAAETAPGGRSELPAIAPSDAPAVTPESEDRSEPTTAAKARDADLADQKKNEEPTRSAGSWRRASAVPNATRLMVGDDQELPLKGLQLNVLVDGFRARVLMDCYYYNDQGRPLEGNFQLRLPDEASLYYFAFGESVYRERPMLDRMASAAFLDEREVRASGTTPADILRARESSWSSVKEARLVPRVQAAHAYGETVRRRVDPALVEWAGAGIFNARVFPLQPGKLHRIVVAYDTNLRMDGKDLLYHLALPEQVPQSSVELNIAAVPGLSAEVTPPASPFLSSGRAYYHYANPDAGEIQVRLAGAENLLLLSPEGSETGYFGTRIEPTFPEPTAAQVRDAAVLMLDTSLSSNPEKFNLWLKMARSLLEENRDGLKRFAVLVFNVETRWWRPEFVENNPENVEQLMEWCHKLSLEGATDLHQALAEASAPHWLEDQQAAYDLFLLSDGAATWGQTEVQPLVDAVRSRRDRAVFAYNTGLTGTATATLQQLTRRTGGALFSIINESEAAHVARAHRQRPWRLTQVQVADARDVLIAGRPEYVYAGQSLLVVGRGTPSGEMVFRFESGDQQHEYRHNVNKVVTSEMTSRLYGQVAVGQLEELTSSEDVTTAYARHFRITGRTCSLLMLESEADYERFQIRPQDDEFVVTSTTATGTMSREAEQLKQMANPKTRLVTWLDELSRTPAVQLQLSPALRIALEQMPDQAFVIDLPRLECRRDPTQSLPADYRDQLSADRLRYDAVLAEAERRRREYGPADALCVLSSLVEVEPGDPTVSRDVAFSALEWQLPGQAFPLLLRVAEMRPYEPQNYLALADCLMRSGNPDYALILYEVALSGQWNNRYREFERIAAMQYLHLLRRMQSGELKTYVPQYVSARLERLQPRVPVANADLVITLMWNTDRSDVDLHVVEPSGERCYFHNRSTANGGQLTEDVTEGYGPEMYWLQKARPGRYLIESEYYGNDANRLQSRTKVYATIYRGFGGPDESVSRHAVVLPREKTRVEIATIQMK